MRAYLKYVERKSQDHVDRTAADRGTQIHTEAELYVIGKGDFTQNLSKFADDFAAVKAAYEAGNAQIEENWGFTADWTVTGWWDDDVWCRVKQDQFIFHPDSEGTIADSVDLKTGKKFGNEVSHNQQGQLYAISSFMRYPKLEVVYSIFKYLDHGLVSKKQYTREKAMKFLPHWNERATRMTSATQFPPKANKITCKWCPFGPQQCKKADVEPICEWGVDA